MAAAIALVWANSPFADAYVDLWRTNISVALGGVELEMRTPEAVEAEPRLGPDAPAGGLSSSIGANAVSGSFAS